jgi:hypothetical protein
MEELRVAPDRGDDPEGTPVIGRADPGGGDPEEDRGGEDERQDDLHDPEEQARLYVLYICPMMIAADT